jgi:ribosomal 30S subunit maturation factor RimM
VLVVKSTGESSSERLIPFIVDEFVISVDLEGRVITDDWDASF